MASFPICIFLILFVGYSFSAVPVLLPYTDWVNYRVMFITAHPDDIEGCGGGLVALLRQQGTPVYYLIVTNGDKGCANTMCQNWTTEEIAAARRIEAVNAAETLNVPSTNVRILNYEDAMVTSYSDLDVRTSLVTVIREIKPHVVITWHLYPDLTLSPSKGWDDLGYHPDHQAVGRYALDSYFDSGIPLFLPQIGNGWAPLQLYFWTFSSATHFVNIESSIQLKIDAYLQHQSQCPNATIVTEMIKLIGVNTATNLGITAMYAEGYTSYF